MCRITMQVLHMIYNSGLSGGGGQLGGMTHSKDQHNREVPLTTQPPSISHIFIFLHGLWLHLVETMRMQRMAVST